MLWIPVVWIVSWFEIVLATRDGTPWSVACVFKSAGFIGFDSRYQVHPLRCRLCNLRLRWWRMYVEHNGVCIFTPGWLTLGRPPCCCVRIGVFRLRLAELIRRWIYRLLGVHINVHWLLRVVQTAVNVILGLRTPLVSVIMIKLSPNVSSFILRFPQHGKSLQHGWIVAVVLDHPVSLLHWFLPTRLSMLEAPLRVLTSHIAIIIFHILVPFRIYNDHKVNTSALWRALNERKSNEDLPRIYEFPAANFDEYSENISFASSSLKDVLSSFASISLE